MSPAIRTWMALLSAGLTVAALAAPPADLREKVQAAVIALSSPRFVERQTAERKLTELGPAALPHLPPPDLVESVAAREALRRVRIHLEQQSATDSLKSAAITVEGERTATELVQELERQSHVSIQISDRLTLTSARRAFGAEPQPFWRLLDSAAAMVEGHWEFDTASNSLRIEPARVETGAFPPVQSWQTSPDSFVVRAAGIESRKLETGSLLRLRLGIAAEPRLRPLLFTFAASDITATIANAEQPLKSWNPAARYELAAGVAGREWPLTADFVIADRDRQAPINLQGEIRVLVATGRESIVFEDWWKARRTWLRRGGATATLGRVRITRDAEGTESAEVDITLTYDTDAPPLESHQRWVLHQAAALRTPDGALIPFARSEVSEEQSGGMSVRYTFERIRDCRTTALIYKPATALLNVPVRFELHGIRQP